MAKVSRRAAITRAFRRPSFVLDRATANDVLMRVNESLDPVPLTDRMWSALVTTRQGLQDDEREESRGQPAGAPLLDAAADAALRDFAEFPDDVRRDLEFLLRVEALLRAWTRGRAADRERSGATIAEAVSAEIRRYLDWRDAISDERRDIVAAVSAQLIAVAIRDSQD